MLSFFIGLAVGLILGLVIFFYIQQYLQKGRINKDLATITSRNNYRIIYSDIRITDEGETTNE